MLYMQGLSLIKRSGTLIYNRKKDQESATGQWFSELVQPNPWYKDVVPDVCLAEHNFYKRHGLIIYLIVQTCSRQSIGTWY